MLLPDSFQGVERTQSPRGRKAKRGKQHRFLGCGEIQARALSFVGIILPTASVQVLFRYSPEISPSKKELRHLGMAVEPRT